MTDEMTAEQKKEAHKELQGEKTTKKKKTRYFTHAECISEMQRLERTGHQLSKYYKDIKERVNKTISTDYPISCA